MRILYVCTANICRSVSAAVLMRRLADEWQVSGVEVASAGSSAVEGSGACPHAAALQRMGAAHSSRRITPELIDWADLVISAERSNQPNLVADAPDVRSRLFTMRQVGRISEWFVHNGMVQAGYWRARQPQGWEQRFAVGDPRAAVAPIPGDPARIDAWFVEELDAARGMAPLPTHDEAAGSKRRRWRSSGSAAALNPDDIADPHTSRQPEFGSDLHGLAYEQIRTSVYWLGAALLEVQRIRDRAPSSE